MGYKDRKPKDPSGSHIRWWHAAIGHPGDRAAIEMIERGLGDVNGVTITKQMYNKSAPWCEDCAKGKCKQNRHKARDSASAGWPKRPNMLHSFDAMGTMIRSMWGHRYSTVVKDHHDGREWTYAHARKDKESLARMLRHHEHSAMIDGRLTKVFEANGGLLDLRVMGYRCDNETNNPYERTRRMRAGIGTEWTIANDGHGQQNAVAERAIATTRTLANILINSEMHNIPHKMARRLWPYAHKHAAHLLLLRPTAHNPGRASPGEMRYAEGKGSNNPRWRARVLHIWGSRMIARQDDHKFKKGRCELRGRSVHYMGVPDEFGPGYLGWDPMVPNAHAKVYFNVTFQEDAKEDRVRNGSAHDETDSDSADTSDIDLVDTDGGAGADTNMGPVAELSEPSSEGSSSEDASEQSEKEQKDWKHPVPGMNNSRGEWKQPGREVDMGNGDALVLWSSADDDTSEQAYARDGDANQVSAGADEWDVPPLRVPKGARRRRRLKRRGRRRRKRPDPAPLEAREEDIAKMDDWAARMYIYKPKDGRSPTFRSLWKTLRDDYHMEESLSDFMSYNGGYDPSSRPQVFEKEDGSRRWVWAPTKLSEQGQGDVPDVESASEGNAQEAKSGEPQAKHEGEGPPTGLDEAGAKAPQERLGDTSDSGDDTDASNAGVAEERMPGQMLTALEIKNAAIFRAEQRKNRRQRPQWYAAMCRIDPRVDHDLGPAEQNERRFERATTLLEKVVDMGAKSVHVGRKRGRNLMRRAESAFTMATCLIMVSVANLVKGIEDVKRRDFPEPKNFKEAIQSEFSELWSAAIEAELSNLKSHGTWEWAELPPGRRCIDTPWRFRAKPTKSGLIDKLKARLCARGFRQIHGFDFTETHAPVTVLSSWRASVAECANYGWDMDFWDISGAYLKAELLETIYVIPPEGLEIPEGMENYVLKLRKALYGLKQAGRAWNKKLTKWLVEYGFVVSDADPSLFILEQDVGSEQHLIRLNVHVDDACAVHTNNKMYMEFKAELMKDFDLSIPSDKDVFLGITVEKLSDGAIKIVQRRYVDDIVAAFLGTGDKPAKTPYVVSWKLSKDMEPQTEKAKKEMAEVPYRRLVGMLLHLANCTRPDIAASVGILGKFNANPGIKHWKAGLEVVKYIKGTADYGVVYGRRQEGIPYEPLCGYSDASWADDPDDRTSRAGIMLWSWGGPIEWRSCKQKSQALSSCEAEYMAASTTAQSVIWAKRLFKQFGYEDLGVFGSSDTATEQEMEGYKPAVIYEDNTGCIHWSKNPVDHQRAKHIDLRYHYVRAKVKDGDIKLVYCETEEMMADLLTKYLSAPRFAYLRDKMLSVE